MTLFQMIGLAIATFMICGFFVMSIAGFIISFEDEYSGKTEFILFGIFTVFTGIALAAIISILWQLFHGI